MKARHSYVAFHTAKWIAGTMNMPRLMKAVYFDVCLFNWHHAEKVSETEIEIMLSDLPAAQANGIIDALVKTERLARDEAGNVWSPKALEEAEKARDLYEAKSRGGKKRRENASTHERVMQDSSKTQGADRESDIESESKKDSRPTVEVDASAPTPAEKQQIVTIWNAMAKASDLAEVVKLTPKRAKALGARLKEHGLDRIVRAIWTIPDNPFLLGENDRCWKAHFDWLVRPDSCAKLIEGGYAQGSGTRSSWR